MRDEWKYRNRPEFQQRAHLARCKVAQEGTLNRNWLYHIPRRFANLLRWKFLMSRQSAHCSHRGNVEQQRVPCAHSSRLKPCQMLFLEGLSLSGRTEEMRKEMFWEDDLASSPRPSSFPSNFSPHMHSKKLYTR